MCPASDAAVTLPPARMGVRGSGPIQCRALKARVHNLAFPILLLTIAPYSPFDFLTPLGARQNYPAVAGGR
jgi:hypothetical protein